MLVLEYSLAFTTVTTIAGWYEEIFKHSWQKYPMEEDSGVWKWCVSERSDHDRPQRQVEEHLQRKPEVKVKFYLFHQLHLSIYSGFGYAFQTPFLWKLLVFLLSVLKTQVEGYQITRWNIVILNGYNIQAKLFSAHWVGSPDFVVSSTQMCGEEEVGAPTYHAPRAPNNLSIFTFGWLLLWW